MLLARMLDGASGGNILVAQAYVADVTPPENRARGMGLIGMAFGLGFVLGPLLGGVLVGLPVPEAWRLRLPFLVAAGFSTLAWLLVLFYLPESRREAVRRPRSRTRGELAGARRHDHVAGGRSARLARLSVDPGLRLAGGNARAFSPAANAVVQAIVSAGNFGIEADQKVLEKGFAYLKECQNQNGSFQYKLGDGTSMKEGTAAAVATLGLMQQFDTQVMVKAYKFLLEITPAGISAERFPYYGHFYGCMGMRLLGQEFKEDKAYREATSGYIADVYKDLLAWQSKDGSWPAKGWMATEGGPESSAYGTAFASLIFSIPDGKLSVYNRTPPKLPGDNPKNKSGAEKCFIAANSWIAQPAPCDHPSSDANCQRLTV